METTRVRFGTLQILIVILALATAAIHFTLLFPDVMFILNALGFVGLVAALYLPLPFVKNRRRLVRFALIGYTLLTIVLWVIMGERSTIGYTAKAIEAVLVVLLFFERP